ncbi:hypothetical protein OF83DRAFT_1089525, partial [Amylostereum chailletii]
MSEDSAFRPLSLYRCFTLFIHASYTKGRSRRTVSHDRDAFHCKRLASTYSPDSTRAGIGTIGDASRTVPLFPTRRNHLTESRCSCPVSRVVPEESSQIRPLLPSMASSGLMERQDSRGYSRDLPFPPRDVDIPGPNSHRGTTPPPLKIDGEALNSTPQSDGSALHSLSADFPSLTQPSVEPWLLQDMKRMEVSTFPDVLKHILSLCVPEGDAIDKDALLTNCLEDVLPLCNDPALWKRLRANCFSVDDEEERYAPFVEFANLALDKLDRATGEGISTLRPPPAWGSGMPAMLARNDAQEIVAHHSTLHGVLKTQRKPDVVVIPEHAAARVYPNFSDPHIPQDSRNDRSKILMESPPSGAAFRWPEIPTLFEFKKSQKKLKDPPKEYKIGVEYEEWTYTPWKGGRFEKHLTGGTAYPNRSSLSSFRSPMDSSTHESEELTSPPSDTARGTKRKLPVNLGEDGPAGSKRAKTNRMPYDVRMASQGVVQTDGMNWIQNLPYFLVLLLAIGRFDKRNWGIPEQFPEHIPSKKISSVVPTSPLTTPPEVITLPTAPEPTIPPTVTEPTSTPIIGPAATIPLSAIEPDVPTPPPPQATEVAIETDRFAHLQAPVSSSRLYFPEHSETLLPSNDPDKPTRTVITPAKTILVHWDKPIHTRYQLFGRATQVYAATEEGSGDELIVKVSFPDKYRVSESRIIRIAQHAEVEENEIFKIEDHLPNLICTMDVPCSDTGDIRDSVGLMKTDKGFARRRVARVSVFEKIEEIVV